MVQRVRSLLAPSSFFCHNTPSAFRQINELAMTKVLSGLFALMLVVQLDARAQNWRLTWADEFNGKAQAAPDSSKWGYQVGGSGWGNNELQYHTNRRVNAYLDGKGHLVIKALKETYTGPAGVTRAYTSARLVTQGKFVQQYGKVEARMKLPFGQGIWPAFWMLGANIDDPGVGWPACGEIDIMENIGKEPSTVHGTLHGPGYSGAKPLTGTFTLPQGDKFSDDFHIFAIEWSAGAIRFFVDHQLYQSKTPKDLPVGSRWVFDHPFFIILNIAVGGNFPGDVDHTTQFPQTMLVDYVRVYADKIKQAHLPSRTIKRSPGPSTPPRAGVAPAR
jgi:beta-glucanase (GH16 family)